MVYILCQIVDDRLTRHDRDGREHIHLADLVHLGGWGVVCEVRFCLCAELAVGGEQGPEPTFGCMGK